jgi:hypothetical protein
MSVGDGGFRKGRAATERAGQLSLACVPWQEHPMGNMMREIRIPQDKR